MNRNLNMNILFYSRECKTCITLIKILENEQLIQYFYPVCVDDKLNKLPPQIEHVPTMIVKDQNKPLVAEETFEWIKKVKFIKQNMQNKNTIIQNNVLASMNKSSLKGFSDIEFGGESDIFAYTKSDAPALPQSYFSCNDEKNNTIFTAPEQSSKITEDEQKKLLAYAEGQRNKQDIQYKDNAKKQQLNAVINKEQEKLMESYKKSLPPQNVQAVNQQEQLQKMQQMQQMQNKIREMKKFNHYMGGNGMNNGN